MAVQFICFIGAALVLLIPGIWLAGALSLGENILERGAIGCSLGLGLTVYIGSGVSHFDLRAFYPAWGLIALVGLIWRVKSKPTNQSVHPSATMIWMGLIFLLVGVTRFAMALPRTLPPGPLDPTFQMILARQIQISHHAIDRWPFANIPLNYPTGSSVLLVILSGISGLPLHTVFNLLIPLLGVLTVAIVYVFAVRMLGNVQAAIYAAGIYGLWAWFGSIDYYRWGGVPNELSMLLFLSMLCIAGASRGSIASRGSMIGMTLLFAAAILVHHHVMVVSSIILGLIIAWRLIQGQEWRPMAVALMGGVILDLFFLVPFALHAKNIHSTVMVIAGEEQLPLLSLPRSLGYCVTVFGVIGAGLCLKRKFKVGADAVIACLALIVMFSMGEDVVPMVLRAMHRTAFTFFTPSRFLTDLNYFLPLFAGGAMAYFARRWRIPQWIIIALLMVAPMADVLQWESMFDLPRPPMQLLDACKWIQQNTPGDTIVDYHNAWVTYLCWREPAHIALPVSEPISEYVQAEERIPKILAGKLAPDSPNMMIVKIGGVSEGGGKPIIWRNSSGAAVFREWP